MSVDRVIIKFCWITSTCVEWRRNFRRTAFINEIMTHRAGSFSKHPDHFYTNRIVPAHAAWTRVRFYNFSYCRIIPKRNESFQHTLVHFCHSCVQDESVESFHNKLSRFTIALVFLVVTFVYIYIYIYGSLNFFSYGNWMISEPKLPSGKNNKHGYLQSIVARAVVS